MNVGNDPMTFSGYRLTYTPAAAPCGCPFNEFSGEFLSDNRLEGRWTWHGGNCQLNEAKFVVQRWRLPG
jgi:hypothetical protein